MYNIMHARFQDLFNQTVFTLQLEEHYNTFTWTRQNNKYM